MKIHLIGGILETACGKDLDSISYTNSNDMVTCLKCKKTKIYKNKLLNDL